MCSRRTKARSRNKGDVGFMRVTKCLSDWVGDELLLLASLPYLSVPGRQSGESFSLFVRPTLVFSISAHCTRDPDQALTISDQRHSFIPAQTLLFTTGNTMEK